MALPTWYSTGTVSVENGSTTVTVTGGFWGDDAIMPGDLFCDPAQPLVPPQRVKSVIADNELELWAPWPGDDILDGAYEVRYVGIIERSTAQTRKVLEQLGDVKAWYDIIVEDDDARLALETEGNPLPAKRRVLVRVDGVIWQKQTSAYGDWIGPVEFKGDTGDKGWSPVYGLVADGERRVEQLIGWVGGEGAAPTASVGKYRGSTGLVDDIEDATDVRGPAGDIDGVTPFWQERLTEDADAEEALGGLGVTSRLASNFNQAVAFFSTLALEQAEDRLTGPVSAGPDGNGFFDGFNVLTYVDVAGASNLDTATAGTLRPSTSIATSLAEITFDSNAPDFPNYNHRMRIAASQLSASGNKVRLTLKGVSSGATAVVTGMYVGHRAASGDAYDFDGTQVAVRVAGSLTFSVPAGATVVTDWISYSLDEARDFIVAFHMSSGDLRRKTPASANFDWWIKEASSEVSVSNVTGYTESGSSDIGMVAKIEVQGATFASLDVKSQTINLAEVPAWVRLFAFVEENGAAINSDLIFHISRDGIDYEQLIMAEAFSRPGGSVCVDSGNASLADVASGTAAKWKITTANGKSPSILAVGVLFGA